MLTGEGLKPVRGTKGSQTENNRNRDAKQNKAAWEGLELVRGTKGSQLAKKGNRSAKQNNADWRRPGTSARGRRMSLDGKQRKLRQASEIL